MREFSTAVIKAAEKLEAEEGRVVEDSEFPGIWWIEGEHGRYRVQLDQDDPPRWITCTCAHGRKKGAGDVRCKHAAAVLMRIKVD